MMKSIKTIGTIVTMGIMLAAAYWMGTMQTKTVKEVQTATEIKEVIPEGYIALTEDFTNDFVDMRTVINYSVNEDGLQLYCADGTGYYWER